MKYEINFYLNNGKYDGVEIEANSLEELGNEILTLAYSKKIESIAEIVELD